MHQFFVTPMQVKEDHIYIEGLDVNHIKNVLRMKVGEALKVSDGNNRKYLCEIESMTAQQVCVRIVEEQQVDTELPSKIYLFQGLPKADKMELIIQKMVELGVYEIVPVSMKRSVVRLDEKKARTKTARWNAISESAAKQSKRSIIPSVSEVLSFKQALERAKELDMLLLPYECAEGMEYTRMVVSKIKPGQSVGIFIGPEGGFDGDELKLAREAECNIITLGKRILRTETAGMMLMSVIMYNMEE